MDQQRGKRKTRFVSPTSQRVAGPAVDRCLAYTPMESSIRPQLAGCSSLSPLLLLLRIPHLRAGTNANTTFPRRPLRCPQHSQRPRLPSALAVRSSNARLVNSLVIIINSSSSTIARKWATREGEEGAQVWVSMMSPSLSGAHSSATDCRPDRSLCRCCSLPPFPFLLLPPVGLLLWSGVVGGLLQPPRPFLPALTAEGESLPPLGQTAAHLFPQLMRGGHHSASELPLPRHRTCRPLSPRRLALPLTSSPRRSMGCWRPSPKLAVPLPPIPILLLLLLLLPTTLLRGRRIFLGEQQEEMVTGVA